MVGIVRWDGGPVATAQLQAMGEVASYRGAVRAWTASGVALGVMGDAELAVPPASDAARPGEPERGVAVAWNGRLDDRGALLGRLRDQGASVDEASTDASLVRAAYLAWGEAFAERLLGDFAVAVWDGERRTLTLARDAMSMRPAYLHEGGQALAFGSEVRQVLAAPGVPRALNDAFLLRFLAGIFTPLEDTARRAVRQVVAGEVRTVAEGRAWRRHLPELAPPLLRLPSEEAYLEAFLEVFAEAVRARTRGPGRVGLMLSGGLDSGAIASVLAQRRADGEPLARDGFYTYSWTFATQPDADEKHLFAPLAARLGVPNRVIAAEACGPLVDPPDHPPHPDEPFTGVYQPLLERILARSQQDGVEVMLSGDRGDLAMGALFLSYPHLLRTGRIGELVGELRTHASLPDSSWAGVLLGSFLAPLGRSFRRKLARVGRAGDRTRTGRALPPWFSQSTLRAHGIDPEASEDRWAVPADLGYARGVRHSLLWLPMQQRGMVWSERTNAAYGQGFADPFSDVRLARFVMSLPQQILNPPGRNDKRFLRAAMRGVMPEASRRVARKVVPTPVYDEAVRTREVARVRALLNDSVADARGYLDGAELRRSYEGVLSGAEMPAEFPWALSLEVWLRRCVAEDESHSSGCDQEW